MQKKFVHLHVHTFYSLLDGLSSPTDLVAIAKEQNSPALAITDHGSMYGVVEFFLACQKAKIKPLIGCEFYLAPRSLHDKESGIDSKRFHLTVLAKDKIGYQNLVQMVTQSYLHGIYYKPRIDFELLKKNSAGLIALSACLNGEVPKVFLEKGKQAAKKVAQKYLDLFGENFYLELQHHPKISHQEIANNGLIEIGQEMNIPLVATNDVHYGHREDSDAHDTLLCIQTNAMKDQENRMSMTNSDFSMRSSEEMWHDFAHIKEACFNTLKIADKCNFEFEFKKNLLPKFETKEGQSDDQFLCEKCVQGVKKRFNFEIEKPINKEQKIIKDRIDYELSIITKMGFSSYFLIVWDFVKWAKDHGIATGPGRGSAAGSLVSFVLEITDINPLEHGLFFERFLNPERVSMPDIDLDFADDRRDEVITFVRQKYGQDRVAQICTFGTMAARAAIKDVGRVFGVPFTEMNDFAKLIPERPGTTLEDALELSKELREDLKNNDQHQKIFNTALKLEGCVRHVSVHACAVVISPDKITTRIPLQHPPKDNKVIITQFSQNPIEDLGLLKMDFLGLRNITILEKAKKIIKRTQNKEIDFSKIDISKDKKTFSLLKKGETIGVFQLESAGMRRYLKELKPTNFNDIVAMVSLFRPGPMDNIPTFIKGKRNPSSVKYPHKVLKEFLKETYGVAVYQEQVQRIAQEFAGFSLGEGYLLIKAVAKKIPSLLKEQREKFISKALEKGRKKEEAEKLFNLIEPFAGYGFNKSHAASYATIACRTAYLKANYPTEFMAALLSCDCGNTDKVIKDIEECERMNITILPPSVNISLKNFTVASKNEIRFGLSAIKGIGDSVVDEILTIREKKEKFKDFEDFISSIPVKTVNKKSLESLAKSGAFSDFLQEKKIVLDNIEEITNFAKNLQQQKKQNNLSLFGNDDSQSSSKLKINFKKTEKSTKLEKLNWEKETLGLFVSDHPLKGMDHFFMKKGTLITKLYENEKLKNPLSIGGIIIAFKKIITKNKQNMASIVLEDSGSKIEVIVFPKVFEKYNQLLEKEGLFFIEGNLDNRNGVLQVLAQKISWQSLEKAREEAKKMPKKSLKENKTIIKKIEKDQEIIKNDPWIINLPANIKKNTLKKINEAFTSFPGKTKVELFIAGKKFPLPQKVKKTDFLQLKINRIIKVNI